MQNFMQSYFVNGSFSIISHEEALLPRFSSNSEESTSELLENLEEMLPHGQ